MKPFLLFAFLIVALTHAAQSPFNHALELDGDEAYVAIPHHPSLSVTQAITIEVRVWAADYDPGDWQEFVFKGGNGPSSTTSPLRQYYIRPENGTGNPEFLIHDQQNNDHSVEGDDPLQNSECYHLAGTYDGHTMKMYVDGVLADVDTVGAITIPQDTGILALGRLGSVSAEEFDGEIDEVRIWNVARTANQICKYVNDTLGPEYYTTADSGLVGYWRLDEGSGTTAFDLSVNQNHGSLENGPAYTTACAAAPCTPTSVQSQSPQLLIAPNPAFQHLHIRMDRPIVQLHLVDISGRTVLSSAVQGNDAQIHLGNLTHGVYFLKIDTESGTLVRKVFVGR